MCILHVFITTNILTLAELVEQVVETCRLVSFVCHYFRFILSLGTYSTQLRAQELFVEVASNLTSVQDCQVRNRMQCGSARHSAGCFAGCCAEKNLSNDFVTPTCQVLI